MFLYDFHHIWSVWTVVCDEREVVLVIIFFFSVYIDKYMIQCVIPIYRIILIRSAPPNKSAPKIFAHNGRTPLQHIWLISSQTNLQSKCPHQCLNTLRPIQNGHHFTDDIFNWIFLNENVWIPIKISMKFLPKGPINNIPALVQIMAWRRPGDKPLSEPMMASLTTHICVTRPQWVNAWCF